MSELPEAEQAASTPAEPTGRKRRRRRRRGKGRATAEAAPSMAVDPEVERMHQVIRQLVSSHAQAVPSGRHRFYFETRDGRVPYLAVNEGSLKALAEGALVIAESPEGRVQVIEAAGAVRVAQLDLAWLRTRRRELTR